MKPASVKWRDWDWDGDPYTPGRISTPGRLIYLPWDLWANSDSPGAAEDGITDVFAAALLNPAQTFILWTDYPERAARCLAGDLFAPNVQRRAAEVMATLAGVTERREYPVRPINPNTGKQCTATEAAAFAAAYGGDAAWCAGLTVPQGAPLFPNVWFGVRLKGTNEAEHARQMAALGDVPAAVRFLFLPGGCVCDYQRYVWGERYEAEVSLLSPKDSDYDIIDTRGTPFRRIDWVLCGGINTPATEFHIAQGIETGTPVWVEAAESLPFDCAVQMWPAQADREPRLTPEIAAEQRRKERNERGGW